MTQIKICGITQLEDAMNAVNEGVNALGFIFYPQSPRYISPDNARKIIRQLPSFVSTIGVFVNESIQTINQINQLCGLRLIQLHGDETPEYCYNFSPNKIIKALYFDSEEDLEKLSLYSCRGFLADTKTSLLCGGTGKIGKWDLIRKASDKYPLILSGGLNSDNIEQALCAVSPMAVDINSGVEISPGKKDTAQITKILQKIQNYDASKISDFSNQFHCIF